MEPIDGFAFNVASIGLNHSLQTRSESFTSFYNIFFGHNVPSFSNRSFKGFPIAMGCFADLSLHNTLHRAQNNAKLPLWTFKAPYQPGDSRKNKCILYLCAPCRLSNFTIKISTDLKFDTYEMIGNKSFCQIEKES